MEMQERLLSHAVIGLGQYSHRNNIIYQEQLKYPILRMLYSWIQILTGINYILLMLGFARNH